MPMPNRDPVADVTDAVLAHLPGYRVDSVARLGGGLDNVAFEVNGELVVRFSTEPDSVRRAELVNREARLLAAVADLAPLPTPRPRFTDAERGCLAYVKLPGVPLLHVPPSRRSASGAPVARALGRLLAALHGAPVERMADLVDTDTLPLVEWRREAEQHYAANASRVPAAHRPSVEAFLAEPPPDDGFVAVFSHNDLGIEHVLVDEAASTVTGVIDWSDAAIVDPAYDFGLLHRDLGPAAFEVALHEYRSDDREDAEALRERASYYARCKVLEDLAYGIDTGEETYVRNSLAAMGWLFDQHLR